MSDLSPLSGVERKLDFGAVRSVEDPERTLQTSGLIGQDSFKTLRIVAVHLGHGPFVPMPQVSQAGYRP